jgi:hydrophobic/amphiphilic exporter-1 (mainly G- bacteria), HAE1 family
MLGGIVVNNAILLVDYTNVLRRRDGMGIRDAVETAGRTRLRPILMTTLTTCLGLVPMSLGDRRRRQSSRRRSRASSSAACSPRPSITLLFVPTLYTLFEEGWKGLRQPATAKHA